MEIPAESADKSVTFRGILQASKTAESLLYRCPRFCPMLFSRWSWWQQDRPFIHSRTMGEIIQSIIERYPLYLSSLVISRIDGALSPNQLLTNLFL